MHNKWYSMRGKKISVAIGHFFVSCFFGVGTWKNAFKKASNVVFFAKETKAPTNAKNVFFIPLAHKQINAIICHVTPRRQFASIGRLENQQKNLKDLIKIANTNDDVIIYGAGHGLKMLRKKLVNFSQYHGLLTKNKLDDTLKTIKALIITSHYEGFPFVIVEALSNGTPVIAFDTFASLHFFAKSQAVFIIPKDDIQAFNQKISWLRDLDIEQYQTISQNALIFARAYLAKELFWQKWVNVLHKVINDNQKLI